MFPILYLLFLHAIEALGHVVSPPDQQNIANVKVLQQHSSQSHVPRHRRTPPTRYWSVCLSGLLHFSSFSQTQDVATNGCWFCGGWESVRAPTTSYPHRWSSTRVIFVTDGLHVLFFCHRWLTCAIFCHRWLTCAKFLSFTS